VSNTGTTILKIAAAAGGAVLGILLARWSDDLLSSRLQDKSEFDKTRYEQGLSAHQPPKTVIEPSFPTREDDFGGGTEN
jgi:hypothetical protein